MKTVLVAALAVVMATAATTATYAAGNPCSPRKDVISQLLEKYKEMPVAIGLASNGNLLEVFAALDGKTWTITQTSPAGLTCLVAAGESWQPQLQGKDKEDEALTKKFGPES